MNELDPLPHDVARVLSHLAHVLDGTIAARGGGIDVRDLAARFLATSTSGLSTTSHRAAGLDFQLTALALAADLDAHPPATIVGSDQEEPPRWATIELGDTVVRFPIELAATFEAGTVAEVPLVVQVEDHHNDGLRISAWSRAADSAAAERYLAGLAERGRAATNPFRGRVLEARWMNPLGLALHGASLPTTKRADLVLPDRVWVELDRNVHGLYGALDRLDAAGLDTTRGVLLAGAPGTGKTAACRVVANELGDAVTVVFAQAEVVSHSVDQLYAHARALAPSLVVLEDVDLLLADRHHRGGGAVLQNFLVALDGALGAGRGVVTLATTNDPAAIDPAARRSSRFDRVVEVPLPDAAARAAILARYLAGVDLDGVDARRVARATEGRSGADLRALVGEAVLHAAGAPITTDLLLGLLRGGDDDRRTSGLYL